MIFPGQNGFSVGLSFNQISSMLRIPFAAITSFVDPAVDFALQFQVEEVEGDLDEHEPAENDGEDEKEPVADDGSNEKLHLAIASLALTVSFTACQKEEIENPEMTTTTEDVAVFQNLMQVGRFMILSFLLRPIDKMVQIIAQYGIGQVTFITFLE